MAIKNLLQEWAETAGPQRTAREYAVRLPMHDTARITALAEMFPLRSETAVITELLTAALDELENCLPYVEGTRIVEKDEQGDPIFEDVGPSRRFYELTRKCMIELQKQQEKAGPL